MNPHLIHKNPRTGWLPPLLFLFLLYPSVAAALTGTVTKSTDGTPLSNVCVNVYSFSGGDACKYDHIAGTQSDANGTYSITTLTTGVQYFTSTHASCTGENQYFVDEFYDGGDGARDCNDAVPVNADDTIDFALANGGKITGTVTDSAGNPIDLLLYSPRVNVYGGPACNYEYVASSGLYLDPVSGTTRYEVYGVPLDYSAYSLSIYPNGSPYLGDWYGTDESGNPAGTLFCNQAETVSFPTDSNDITNIHFKLREGAIIQGTVTDSDTKPIADTCISILRDKCPDDWQSSQIGGAQTDATGLYSIPVEPGSSYYVYADPSCGGVGTYLREYWNEEGGSSNCDEADATPTTAIGSPVPIDFQLEKGAFITGIILGNPRDESLPDAPLENVCIDVFEGSACDWGNVVANGSSGPDGSYSIAVEANKNYTVHFDPHCMDDNTSYLSQYWAGNSGASPYDCINAEELMAGNAGTSVEANVTLEEGSTVRGTVYGEGAGPINGLPYSMWVDAYSGDACNNAEMLNGSEVHEDGSYQFSMPKDQQFMLRTWNNNAPYLQEWFAGWDSEGHPMSSPNCADAYTLSFYDSETSSYSAEISEADFELDQAALIQGRATLEDETTPVPNICVNVFSGSDCNLHWIGSNNADENGNYTIPVQPGERYYLQTNNFCSGQYPLLVDEYWDGSEGSYSCSTATQTPVATIGTPIIANFKLGDGVLIEGVVTDQLTTDPVANIVVSVHQPDCNNGNYINSTTSQNDGSYELLVPPATEVYLATCTQCQSENDYLNLWYNNVRECEEASTIQGPATVNWQLPTDSDGDELSDAEEALYGLDPNLADTNGDGVPDYGEVYLWTKNANEHPGEPDMAWDGDIDGDGTINIHDADADGDGISNLQELARGSDFADGTDIPPALSSYDDFSSPSLAGEKWRDTNQYARERVNNTMRLMIDSNSKVRLSNRLQTVADNIKTTFKVTELNRNPGDIGSSVYYGVQSIRYSTNSDPISTIGKVIAEVAFSDDGNGLEAWYWIGRFTSENYDVETLKYGQLVAPGGGLALNTTYTLEQRYDGSLNQFTFTLYNETDGVIATTIVDNTDLPTPVSAIDSECSLTARTSTTGGRIDIAVDTVETSDGSAPYTAYDDFTGTSENLDPAKWRDPAYVREVTSDGKLRLVSHSFSATRTTSAYLVDRFNYIETKVKLSSESFVDDVSKLKTRIDGMLYNVSRGPGSGQSYNGYQDNVWAEASLLYDENSTSLSAIFYASRITDKDWNGENDLFSGSYPLDVDLNDETEFTLYIGFAGDYIVVGVDYLDGTIEKHFMEATDIHTTTYPPYMPYTEVISRAYGNGGEGLLDVSFDNIMVSGDSLDKQGDVNGDGKVDLEDAINGLKATTGTNSQTAWLIGDTDGDGKVGLPEIIDALKQQTSAPQ